MDNQLSRRWRLILGRFANMHLSQENLSDIELHQDQALEKLYGKELEKRGIKIVDTLSSNAPLNKGGGTLDTTNVKVFNWLDNIDDLFPKSVGEQIKTHAVQKFGIKQLLNDEKFLTKVKPSITILKEILAVRSELDSRLMFKVRYIIQSVVDELLVKIKPMFRQKLYGRLNKHQSSPQAVLANLDWRKTVRSNLKHFNIEKQQLFIQRIYFGANNQRFIPWRVILCIDQSGSMVDSVIYSAVIAGILSTLPTVDLKLVLFDTNVVDMSDKADDPVEVLMRCQMSGGTLIKTAWEYCLEITEQPAKTIIVTVSDFYEGGSYYELISQAKVMIESGIKMLGVTAMDADAESSYDAEITAHLSQEGMKIASLSPDKFADWLAKVMEI